MRQFWANLFSFLFFFCPDSDPKPLQVSKVGTTIGQKIGIVRGSGTKVEYLGPLAKNRPKIALLQ